MRTRIVLCSALSCLALVAGAQTEKPTPRSLSLQECIDLALKHNLSVQISRFGPEISLYDLESSYGVYDPTFSLTARQSFSSTPGRVDAASGLANPSADNFSERYTPGLSSRLPSGATVSLDSSLTRDSGTSFPAGYQYRDNASITLTQPLLKNGWIDSTRQSIQLLKNSLQGSELTLRSTIISTVATVQQVYYDLIFNFENVKVQEKALELAEKLLAENKKRVEVGALAPLDEKQAESQVAQGKADLISAQAQLGTQQRVLRNLLTDDYTSWQNVIILPTESLIPVPPDVDLQQSWNRGLTGRPDFLQEQLNLERQNITLKYNFNQLFPSLDLSASYGHNGIGNTLGQGFNGVQNGKSPFYSYQLVFSIPLTNRKARNDYQNSKTKVQQSLLSLKKKEQDVLVEIDNAVGVVRTNYEKIDATRQARLYAEAALDAEQKKLESGKSTSFQVLSLQRELTSKRSAEIRALADYSKALADLAQKEGSTLEKNKLSVEFK
jgi:outer membrane protein